MRARTPGEPTATSKVVAYACLAGTGLLAAVVFGNVAVVALAAPFAFALVIGLSVRVAPLPQVCLEIQDRQLLEGGRVTICLELFGTRADTALRCRARHPCRPSSRGTMSMVAQTGRRLPGEVGGADQGGLLRPVRYRSCQPYGSRLVRPPRQVGSRGRHAGARRAAESRGGENPCSRALEVRATAGDQLARQHGDGIEFAEVRAYSPGMPGRINWRVTARRGEPYVNLRHPERSTDVILLLDTFAAAVLPRQVRATAGLAAAYLGRHDRVGLVAFGGVLHWVEPAMGQAQLKRIVAALTTTQWHHSYAWKSAEGIPSRTLPPTALVIAITALDDARMLRALATIRARGVDLAVLETIGPRPTRIVSPAGEIASRIIELERMELRDHFARRGVPVVACARRRAPRGASRCARRLATAGTRAGREMNTSPRTFASLAIGPFSFWTLRHRELGRGILRLRRPRSSPWPAWPAS